MGRGLDFLQKRRYISGTTRMRVLITALHVFTNQQVECDLGDVEYEDSAFTRSGHR